MWSRKHPTTLGGHSREKSIPDDHPTKTESSDEPIYGGVKCASVNTGTDVISMFVVPVKLQYGKTGMIVKTYSLLDGCSQGTFILKTITDKTLIGEVPNKSTIVERLKISNSGRREEGRAMQLFKEGRQKASSNAKNEEDIRL